MGRFEASLESIGLRTDRWFRPILNVVDGRLSRLADEAPPDSAVALLLLVWVLASFAFVLVTRAPFGLPRDLTELYAWSRHLDWSFPKHPPLSGAIAAVWFLVFPVAEWSFYLLGAANVGVTLWVVWLIAKRWLPPDRQIVALTLTALVPLVTFMAFQFNANAVQLPWWALTTYFFLRSFETRGGGFAAAAGAAAAAAVLAKYYSVFLLAGLVIAALSHTDRKRYFLSPAPWITVAVGLLCLVPHAHWVLTHRATPISYASVMHSLSRVDAFRQLIRYPLAVIAYAGPALIAYLLAVRPSVPDLSDVVWPADAGRRMRLVAFAAPMVLAGIVPAVIAKSPTASWLMPAWSLFGVVLLSPVGLAVTRQTRVRALATMIGFALMPLVTAPLVMIVLDRQPQSQVDGDVGRWLAPRIQAEWQATTPVPLAYVGGVFELTYSAAYYLGGRVEAFPNNDPLAAPWIDPEDVDRRGIVMICGRDLEWCRQLAGRMLASHPGGHEIEVSPVRTFLGREHRFATLTLTVIPPRVATN